MPLVHMHLESADGLVDEYRNAAGNVRDVLADLSPYVTDAYELLGRGGNPSYGPRAALQTLANDWASSAKTLPGASITSAPSTDKTSA